MKENKQRLAWVCGWTDRWKAGSICFLTVLEVLEDVNIEVVSCSWITESLRTKTVETFQLSVECTVKAKL